MQRKNQLILILTLLSLLFYTTAQAASDARLYLTVSNEPSATQTKTISVNVENAPLVLGAIPKNGTNLHKSPIYQPWAKAQG